MERNKKEKVKLDTLWNSHSIAVQAIKKTSALSLVTLWMHISTTPTSTCNLCFVVIYLECWVFFLSDKTTQTGEHSFMQTLDWCQLDWRGMKSCKEKLGASYPAAPRCRHIKERSEAFWYRGEDSRTSFSPDSSPQCAFVDYCLVFPRRAPHRR